MLPPSWKPTSPIQQTTDAMRSQRLKSGWLNQEKLRRAYEGINVSPEVLGQIGPAVNSGKSFLIYGQPGNGKTYLAETNRKVFIEYVLLSGERLLWADKPVGALDKPAGAKDADDVSADKPLPKFVPQFGPATKKPAAPNPAKSGGKPTSGRIPPRTRLSAP